MMHRIIAVVLGLLLGCTVQAQSEAVWIDVRTAEEYAAGHVEGAINILNHNFR